MSLTNPNKVVTEQRLNEYHNAILPYLGGTAEAGFTPVGTVIAVMGNTAPANYLVCNGQVVNIADHPVLADYFEAQFGTKNHFGGDGITTFAIPDLRGEFLRGTGTNNHTNQGSGANVGVHQDATQHLNITGDGSADRFTIPENVYSTSPINNDGMVIGTNYRRIHSMSGADEIAANFYNSRPTNTSVLYCIATHNIFMNPELQYSTQEQVVGTWIDGKPIYQKTVNFTTPSSVNTDTNILTIANGKSIVEFNGLINRSDGGQMPIGSNYSGQSNCIFFTTGVTIKVYFRVEISVDTSRPAYITLQYTKTTD